MALLVLQGSEVFFDIFIHGSIPFHIVGKHQLSSTKRNVIQCHGKGKNSRQWAVSRVLTTLCTREKKETTEKWIVISLLEAIGYFLCLFS